MGTLTVVEASRLGNIARTKKLSPERRKEIAQLAARARWAKKASPDPDDPNGSKPKERSSGILSTRKACRQTGVSSQQPTLFEISEPLHARAA